MLFLVTVSDPPSSEVKQRDSGNPVEGSSFTLTCHITDGNPRNDIRNVLWKKGDSIISHSDHYQLTGQYFIIRSLNQLGDDGFYSCAAGNEAEAGVFSDTFQLLVLRKYLWNCRYLCHKQTYSSQKRFSFQSYHYDLFV